MTEKIRRPPESESKARTKSKAAAPRKRKYPQTKRQIALSLLKRTKGASIAEMQNAMGWQAHSVRGFLAGTVRKLPGVTLVSDKTDNEPRRYRIQATGE